jgi:uncharacterized lipoprotein YajG
MDKNKLLRSILNLYLLLLLPGCALSPQTIRIAPLVEVERATMANNTRLAIEVRDSRQSNIIGYRGGIYDTAAISTGDNITGPLHSEIARVFRESGFQIVERGSTFDASLIFDVEQLNYIGQQKNLIWTIEVTAVISTRAVSGTRTLSNKVEDRMSKDFATAPSARENESLINGVISRVLERLVQDENLLNSLRSR